MTKILVIIVLVLAAGVTVLLATQSDEQASKGIFNGLKEQVNELGTSISPDLDDEVSALLLPIQKELEKLNSEIIDLELKHESNKFELDKYKDICSEQDSGKIKDYCTQSALFAEDALELSSTLENLKTHREELTDALNAMFSKKPRQSNGES